ncbi:MAG: GspE/PulE family protein [Planctomycetota bacterium]
MAKLDYDRKVAAVLVSNGLIGQEQVTALSDQARSEKKSLTQVITEQNLLSEDDVVACIAHELGMPPIHLDRVKFDPEVVASLKADAAKRYQVLPLSRVENVLTVAMANPFDILTLDDIKVLSGCTLIPVVASELAIERAIGLAYKDPEKQVDAVGTILEEINAADIELTGEAVKDEEFDLASLSDEKSPIVRYTWGIIMEAIRIKASDIHLETFEKEARLRYRLDGACRVMKPPPFKHYGAITSRIKILSEMDIAERRVPQDGKFQVRYQGKQIDFRVSTLPMVHGEKICIRILDSSNLSLSLDSLGFEKRCLDQFKWAVNQPYGMMLVTGPTGSGKSTTLYSCVKETLNEEDNINTVEDPVEYQLLGVNQCPVNPKRGMTFAKALKALLRQDPDTIMIGEIRDQETAEIAIKAALTGHLVLSTLHTNDAPSTITRIVDMGVDRFQVSSSIILICAQRLLRKLCPECKQPTEIPPERLLELGVLEEEIPQGTWFKAGGCPACMGKGYKGRFAVLETLQMTEPVRRIVIGGGSALDIRAQGLEEGMLTLRRVALLNAMRGKTSIDQVMAGTADEV